MKAKTADISTALRLLVLFREHLGALILGCLLLMGTTALTLFPPILIRGAVDNIADYAHSGMLLKVFILIIAATFIKGVLYYIQRVLMESTGQKIVHELRTKVFLHVNKLSYTFFDKNNTGDLVSRVTSDIETLARFYGFGLVNIINNLLTLIGILGVLVYWRPILSVGFLVFLPFILHAIRKYATEVRPVMSQVRRDFGRLTATVQQSLSGIETIKLLGVEEHEINNFNRKASSLRARNIRAGKITALWLPYVHFLMALGTALTFLWGGWLVIKGLVTPGMLLGFLTYIGMLLRPIRQTGMLIGMSMTSLASAKRVFELLDEQTERLDGGQWPDQLRGEIELENVTFAYANGHSVIKDFSLDISAGKTVALVGPSGAGKSTVARLIMGLYQPQQGSVLIDGISINDIDLGKWRLHVGYLRQFPFLFDGTIFENLTFGKPEATLDEVVAAARKAMLHEFVMSLPQGYNTRIGERGVRLSGGQKQRLAMARMLVTDPLLLVLDEPTSNLDRDTEQRVNAVMQELFKNRTVIVIAHRLWTIQNADLVAFIKDGRLFALGNHEQLYSECSEYAAFVEAQLKSKEAS